MDGFKNTTRTQYSMGGYAKGGSLKGAAKVGKVMGEFKAGTLHSGSKRGPEVTNPKQAIAIGLSEARKASYPVKKAGGGSMTEADRRQIMSEVNDMNPADRARALKMIGPSAVSQRAQENTMQSSKRGAVANVKPATKGRLSASDRQQIESEYNDMGASDRARADALLGYKKGGSAKGPSVERSKSVSTKSKVTPTMNAQEVRRMEKYKAAMASRPNRQPVIAEGKRTAAALTPIIRRAMAAKAAQAAQAAQAAAPTPPVMDEGAAPMGALMAGAPAMKKGGKARFQVMRKAEGGAVVGYDVGGPVTLAFTPPSPAPEGQRWIERDDGQLLLVSDSPDATYVGRSGATKRVSDLSIYQGGMADRPAANFVANDAPDVLANLRSVGGLDNTYVVPTAGTQPVVVPAAPPVVSAPTNRSVPTPVAPPPAPPTGVDPRALAEAYRASVPGYSYGEAPAGERQFFNYAMAPGASPPWMADTSAGLGVYDAFGNMRHMGAAAPPVVVAKKMGGAISASKVNPSARTAQKYAAAMASRPNREPMIKRDMGGMASSTRSTKDYHKSDTDFVASRGEQLNALVGKKMAKGGEGSRGDLKQDKAMIKAAVHKHERHDHPGKPLTKLRKGGTPC